MTIPRIFIERETLLVECEAFLLNIKFTIKIINIVIIVRNTDPKK